VETPLTHPPGSFDVGPDRLCRPFFSRATLPSFVQPHPPPGLNSSSLYRRVCTLSRRCS
jgi:hypothetical protein